MAGETTITIVGNLTADPELRYTNSGVALVTVSIANTSRVFDRQSNGWKEGDTLFLRATAWRELAENIANSLEKGMRVIATGRLQQRSWESREGERRSSIEMQIDEIAPSLRYATAKVTRIPRGDGYGQNQGGYNTNAGFGGGQGNQGGYGQQSGNQGNSGNPGGYGQNQGYAQMGNQGGQQMSQPQVNANPAGGSSDDPWGTIEGADSAFDSAPPF